MILAAGLLVLLGLGLFVAGLATGTTVLYWATVAVCAVAAVLLVLSRRALSAPRGSRAAPDREADAAATPRRSAATRELPVPQDEAAAAVEQIPADEREPVAHEAPAATVQPAAAAVPAPSASAVEEGEPPVEEVEVTDLLLVVDLTEDVFVIDEHPRYHVAECPRLAGREPIPLPLDEARTDGFTPCGVCSPDRTLAERERARRAGRQA